MCKECDGFAGIKRVTKGGSFSGFDIVVSVYSNWHSEVIKILVASNSCPEFYVSDK